MANVFLCRLIMGIFKADPESGEAGRDDKTAAAACGCDLCHPRVLRAALDPLTSKPIVLRVSGCTAWWRGFGQ